jgi:hypothetical protein
LERIADSCTNVSQIAADYESVITTLGVTRLDMDVEAKSLNDTAGITRRNQAIAMTEAWAASNGIPLQIQYTLPVEQLASIYPSLSSAQLWNMEGMTLLPGIDDYPKKTEVTALTDAQTMLNFAQANNMNFLSIWAIQRDNGGCPGTRDSNTCSGITQNTWDFSHLLEPFTG